MSSTRVGCCVLKRKGPFCEYLDYYRFWLQMKSVHERPVPPSKRETVRYSRCTGQVWKLIHPKCGKESYTISKLRRHPLSCRSKVQRTKAETEWTKALKGNRNKSTANLEAIETSIQRQVHVATGSSCKTIQPLQHCPRMNTSWILCIWPMWKSVSARELHLPYFLTLCSLLWNLYDTGLWQLTESLEIKTGDSLFGSLDLLILDHFYSVQGKTGKSSYEHGCIHSGAYGRSRPALLGVHGSGDDEPVHC